jgi:predicted ester cyclase
MSIESNKAVVRRYFEEALMHPEIYDEILDPGFHIRSIHHATINPEGEESGPAVYKAAAEWLRFVWKSPYFTVDEMIAEDDRVMTRWTFHGTQQGEFLGIPPTNKGITYSGINIFQVVDGKLIQGWDIFDRLWLWQQLDVLPDTDEFLAQARNAKYGQGSNP